MIIEDFHWRYATKSFDPGKTVGESHLQILKDALRLSPSSFGLQPWKFIFISDASTKGKLFPVSWGNKQVQDCSHLVVMCSPLSLGDADVDKLLALAESATGANESGLLKYAQIMKDFLSNLDEAQKQRWMSEQIHIALGFLMAAAAQIKVDTCPMGGFLSEEYDKILNLKEKGLRSVVLCALGYRDEADKYAHAPKLRFKESDVIESL